MAIPPLHHCIHDARVNDVRLGQCDRHREIVEYVQYRDRDDKGAIEPVGHVDVLYPPFVDRAEENNGISHPNDRDQQVDRPFEFGVFLALRNTERQRDCGQHDNELPAPERKRREFFKRKSDVAGPLNDVIRCREQGRTAECENDGIRVQRPQAAVAQERQAEVQIRPDQLRGDDHTDEHADDAPDNHHQGELTYNFVVVGSCCVQGSSLLNDMNGTAARPAAIWIAV